MEKNRLQSNKDVSLGMSEELLKFTGQRMPRYTWLLEGCSAKKPDSGTNTRRIDDKWQ